MKILYFTGTGNCLYVAKRIGGDLYSIPQLIKNDIYTIEDRTVGIIFPCYCWTLPRIVKNYLKKVEIRADYTFTIITYGTMAQSTLKQTEKLLKGKVDYTNEIKMIDNYLPMFNMEKEIANEEKKQIESQIDSVIKDIQLKKHRIVKKRFYNDIFSKFGKLYLKTKTNDVDKKFRINDNCNLCRTCESLCPVKNIKIVENQPVFQHNCEFCHSCIQLCPQNAIHLKNEKSSARFKNKNIKLSEIKKANNQLKN